MGFWQERENRTRNMILREKRDVLYTFYECIAHHCLLHRFDRFIHQPHNICSVAKIKCWCCVSYENNTRQSIASRQKQSNKQILRAQQNKHRQQYCFEFFFVYFTKENKGRSNKIGFLFRTGKKDEQIGSELLLFCIFVRRRQFIHFSHPQNGRKC